MEGGGADAKQAETSHVFASIYIATCMPDEVYVTGHGVTLMIPYNYILS